MNLENEMIKNGAREIPINDLQAIPGSGGVYFLCSACRIKYIGQSGMLRTRITGHRDKGKKFCRVFIILYPGRERLNYERFFIDQYKPRLNNHLHERNILSSREKKVALLRKLIDLKVGNI